MQMLVNLAGEQQMGSTQLEKYGQTITRDTYKLFRIKSNTSDHEGIQQFMERMEAYKNKIR